MRAPRTVEPRDRVIEGMSVREPMRVLVVGAEGEVAASIASLRDDGHLVDHARDAFLARRTAEGKVHDAVLVDLDIEDGVSLARSLRTEVLPAGTSIIGITARPELDSSAVGADLVLQKRIETVGLGSLIEYMIRQRRRSAPR
jgi:DNA-binding response OmpR family regulator